MDYLMIKGFVEMERVNGETYVIVKRTDADLYKYRLLKIENENEICISRHDTKNETRNALKQIRMDARDRAIQARRETLERKGINAFAKHGGSMKQIYEAYRDARGF